MKIAIWHHLPSGGGKRALYDHVKSLRDLGHTVEAWCPPSADRTFLPLTELVDEAELPVPLPELNWTSRTALRAMRQGEALWRRLAAMDAHARAFAHVVHDRRYDVVFANSCRWFNTPAVARYVRVPTVLYLGEPYRPLYEARPALPWLAEPPAVGSAWTPWAIKTFIGSAIRVHPFRVQAREELRNARAFTRILVNSHFSRESVLRAFNVDARVCYLGINRSDFYPAKTARQPFVLSVGAFRSHKNAEFIIRAVGRTRSRPRLVWVANVVDDAYATDMRTLADGLGVVLEIHVGVSDDRLRALYASAWAFAYAPRLEPFGLAPLEAAACGTPIVAVAEGGVRETVIDNCNGLLVDADGVAFAAALDRLFEDPHLARRLGDSGAAEVRRTWSSEAAGRRLENELNAVARLSTPATQAGSRLTVADRSSSIAG
jgi:glycosyltransferase involved in cell wall biosynthesis